jgi:hypothetical protein
MSRNSIESMIVLRDIAAMRRILNRYTLPQFDTICHQLGVHELLGDLLTMTIPKDKKMKQRRILVQKCLQGVFVSSLSHSHSRSLSVCICML